MTSCRDLVITNKDVYFTERVNSIVYKKAMLSQGNRAMPL